MITESDYQQLHDWFLSAMLPIVTNQVSKEFNESLNNKLNRCEEIYSTIDKDFATVNNENVAKLSLTYQSGTSGSIDSNGLLNKEVSVISGSNLQSRFEKTGNYLTFSFNPLPASVKYVESISSQLMNFVNSKLNEHNNIPYYTTVHAPAFTSFSGMIFKEIYDRHDTDVYAHKNLISLENYYNKDTANAQLEQLARKAQLYANNSVKTHNNSAETSIHAVRFNTHNTDKDAHKNLESLTNYYNKNEIDAKETTLKSYINNEDYLNKNYVKNTIEEHNTNDKAHEILFNKKADILNPIFTNNVTVKNDLAVNNAAHISNIVFNDDSITLNGSVTVSSSNAVFVKAGIHDITIIDSSGNSNFKNLKSISFSALNGVIENVNENNGKTIPNVDWCNKRIGEIMPYGSMPDYANLEILQKGDVSYVWKVNVPGYIMISFGNNSDTDFALFVASNPDYLQNLKRNTSNVFKMAEGFGYGDGDQSSICIPIFPGTQTYIRPAIDNSKGNVKNAAWLFVPCLATREFEGKRSIFIQQITQNLGNSHLNKNTSGYYKAAEMFNTKSDQNIWINNLN